MAMPGADKEAPCYLLIGNDVEQTPSPQEVQQTLTKGTLDEKVDMMKKLIKLIIHDESFPKFTMLVLQCVAPSEDHELKKLLLLYWEVIEKRKADGAIKDELMLACNSLRKDLLHSNEFIRGRTLRLVSKMLFRPLLEPLIQVVIENLQHRHSYVRRNALACLFAVFAAFGNDMLGGLPDRLEAILADESDVSSKRNAFLLLYHCDEERALAYLRELQRSEDGLTDLHDLLQLLIIELLRRSCALEPTDKARYLGILVEFVRSRSPAVILECANTLVGLSRTRRVVQLALSGYIRVLAGQTENNVILFVLEKIWELVKARHKGDLQEHVGDILCTLSSASLEIRQKALDILLELVNEHNVSQVLDHILKSLRKDRDSPQFQCLWLTALRRLACSFPQQTYPAATVPLLEEYLGLPEKLASSSVAANSENGSEEVLPDYYIAYEVAQYAHKAMETVPAMGDEVLARLVESFCDIVSPRALTLVLWILGEYSRKEEDCVKAISAIREGVGPIPIVARESSNSSAPRKEEDPAATTKKRVKTVILPDGTYATKVVEENEEEKKSSGPIRESQPETKALRTKLLEPGCGYLSAALGACMTKLVLRLRGNVSLYNHQAVQTLIVLCGILNAKGMTEQLEPGHRQRLISCIKLLAEPDLRAQDLFLGCGGDKFSRDLLGMSEGTREKPQEPCSGIRPPESSVVFRQFGRTGMKSNADYEVEEGEVPDLAEERVEGGKASRQDVQQLTGYSEPVYAELFVETHDTTVVANLVLINRSSRTLQNVTVELLVREDVKAERPAQFNLAPQQVKSLRFVFRIGTTEESRIFGYLTYSGSSGNVPHLVPFDSVPICIADNLLPEEVSETFFTKLWNELPWESTHVATLRIGSPYELLAGLTQSLGLSIVRKLTALDRTQDILAANFHGRTKFGERVVMNVTLERVGEEKAECVFKTRAKNTMIATWMRRTFAEKIAQYIVDDGSGKA